MKNKITAPHIKGPEIQTLLNHHEATVFILHSALQRVRQRTVYDTKSMSLYGAVVVVEGRLVALCNCIKPNGLFSTRSPLKWSDRGWKRSSWGDAFQSEASAAAPVAKGSGVSRQPALLGSGSVLGGGVSYGPVSVTWWRCGLDWGCPGGHCRCAVVNHSMEWKKKKGHFLPCCVSLPWLLTGVTDQRRAATSLHLWLTVVSERLTPGINKTWGIPKEGDERVWAWISLRERNCCLEYWFKSNPLICSSRPVCSNK